jgi:uncharacterized protein YigA (DUF484 family)
MNEVAVDLDEMREKILSEPDVILDDRDIMHALIAANEKALGTNIIDLRGIAMERLESRLDRLEDTHRSVIAAAYDNLAGTNQIHRAILAMLDPITFEGFLKGLGSEVAAILRVECIRLVLESPSGGEGDTALGRLGDVLSVVEPGYITDYVTQGREGAPIRPVTLRQLRPNSDRLYGEATQWINSEALILLNFGEGRQRGMLALGAEDPHQFRPNQATDLLSFFAGIFERQMRRWLG